ncbi:desumoylating isopeptidase 1-like [Orbicella faveolata]|uniref:desumoylating isopeptidase 1-like n=1 Tax=Orbicella faveolata TaxID=48498 RepID=UPI0009E38B68|nr:desumoylating isopeptidase 1-like [Orbicella faveolata]
MLCNDYWFFEGGTILGSPDEVLDLGDTEVTQVVFMDFFSGIEGQHFRVFGQMVSPIINSISVRLSGGTSVSGSATSLRGPETIFEPRDTPSSQMGH